MEQHAKWWKRAYTAWIKNKTRKEVSETTWHEALIWVRKEMMKLRADDSVVNPLLMLARKIDEELAN